MSVPAREDALERDAPVQYEVRLAVLVRLAAADVRDGARRNGGEIGWPRVCVGGPGQDLRVRLVAVLRGSKDGVVVGGHLADGDRVGLLADRLALREGTPVERNPAAH